MPVHINSSDHIIVFLSGVYRIRNIDMYIDVNGVKELHDYTVDDKKLTIGANVSLSVLMDILTEVADEKPRQFSYLHRIAAHIDLVANVPVRNVSKFMFFFRACNMDHFI